MPRRSRKRMLGKRVQAEQEEREESLWTLLTELRIAARTAPVPVVVARSGRRR